MRARRLWFNLVGSLALISLPAPAGAQRVGSEFRVNTYTTGRQQVLLADAVAGDANGNFVVVWYGPGQGLPGGIFGQRYDSPGTPVGSEFRVNSFTTGRHEHPAVVFDASGNSVVVWDGGGNQDVDGIFGQRYDHSGSALGGEFRVNSYTTYRQANPSIASDADGNFVVVWGSREQDGSDDGIFGQRYDNEGMPRGSEFRVNSYTTEHQRHPSVAAAADGHFVVVWMSSDQDGSDHGIFGQRYDDEGVAQGSEFRVNSYTTDRQWFPSIASDPNGNFVVAWWSRYQDGSGDGIFGQRYDSAGSARGGEFRVNSYTTNDQSAPKVASDASGNFLVVWQGFRQPHDFSGNGIFGQLYDSGGAPLGDCEFQVNSYTPAGQRYASVGATGTKQFVVAWESIAGQDGFLGGVFGQRLDFASGIWVMSPNCSVRWRIGALETIQWTHSLGAGATFRIELDRDDDGTFEELIADDAPADSATKGSFVWIVTGPRSGTARVRVAWTDDLSISDASDVTFQIRPVGLDD